MDRNRTLRIVLAGLAGIGMTASALGQQPAAIEPETAPAARLVISVQANGSRPVPVLHAKDVEVLVKNRPVEISGWTPLEGSNADMQLVFLIDESVRSYFALQIPSLKKFILSLPPTAEVAVAYMNNGRAQMAQTLTPDHALAANSLRLTNGIPGISASPYFCLSDLAKNWPSQARSPRRVVFMVTNGEDPYYRGGDLQDPYVYSAIADSQKAGLMVYSIYFRNVGSGGSRSIGTLYGQSYLLMVATGTGGVSYTQALSSPVSFDPFLKQFKTSLDHQYRATLQAPGSGLLPVKVKSKKPGVKLAAASKVYVAPAR